MSKPLVFALALFLALLALRPLLEARMVAHMLLDLPLLVCVGMLPGQAWRRDGRAFTTPWNHRGVSGLVLASLAVMFWMLPRSLDAAAGDPLIDAAKHASLPLLAGIPLALSWPRAGFVVRGVLLLELIASCFRLGWIYMITPLRLCNNYALDDQRLVGECLLGLGAVLFFWIAWKLLWGGLDTRRFAPGTNH